MARLGPLANNEVTFTNSKYSYHLRMRTVRTFYYQRTRTSEHDSDDSTSNLIGQCARTTRPLHVERARIVYGSMRKVALNFVETQDFCLSSV